MSYDNIESIWRHLLIKADISLVSDFWFEVSKKIFYYTKLKYIEIMRFRQSILTPFWASFFKNLNFFHFSWHIIWLVCRAVMLFLLTQRSKLGKLFTYLEHGRKAHKKVSRGFWQKVSAQKMRFCQNILTTFWASFFQNLNSFHFSWHILWLVCRAVMLFLLAQRSKLCKLFRYLEHARKVHRKVSRGFWKKVCSKNEVLSEYFNPILSFIFENLNFF